MNLDANKKECNANKKECNRLLNLCEKAPPGSEEKRDVLIRLFTCSLKVAFEDDGEKYMRLREVTLKKVKEAMTVSYMISSMDKLKEFLLILENVDWRPWLHDAKFPKKFRDPLSTLVVLAKAGLY